MYYFSSKADWDGAEDGHDDGFEVGAAVEYSVLSNLDASLGFLYTDQGADDESYVYLNPALTAITVCGGGIYQVTEDLSLELGLAGIFYQEDSGESLVGMPVDMIKNRLHHRPGRAVQDLLRNRAFFPLAPPGVRALHAFFRDGQETTSDKEIS